MTEPNQDLKKFLEELLKLVPTDQAATTQSESTWQITEEASVNLESEY